MPCGAGGCGAFACGRGGALRVDRGHRVGGVGQGVGCGLARGGGGGAEVTGEGGFGTWNSGGQTALPECVALSPSRLNANRHRFATDRRRPTGRLGPKQEKKNRKREGGSGPPARALRWAHPSAFHRASFQRLAQQGAVVLVDDAAVQRVQRVRHQVLQGEHLQQPGPHDPAVGVLDAARERAGPGARAAEGGQHAVPGVPVPEGADGGGAAKGRAFASGGAGVDTVLWLETHPLKQKGSIDGPPKSYRD